MFNIQPGQGLGFSANKQIALGLGTPFELVEDVVVVLPRPVPRVGGISALEALKKKLLKRKEPGYDIHRDDQEVLEIIIEAILSGILE